MTFAQVPPPPWVWPAVAAAPAVTAAPAVPAVQPVPPVPAWTGAAGAAAPCGCAVALIRPADTGAEPAGGGPVGAESAASGPATLLSRFAAFLVLSCLLVALTIVLGSRVLFGWAAYEVTSGSMEPAIRPGDLILVEPKQPGTPFDAPTIITYRDDSGRLVTHRVVEASRAGDGEVRYRTKGDANPEPDADSVGHGEVVGSVRVVLRGAALPASWARHGHGGPLAVSLLTLLAAVWVATGAVSGKRRRTPP